MSDSSEDYQIRLELLSYCDVCAHKDLHFLYKKWIELTPVKKNSILEETFKAFNNQNFFENISELIYKSTRKTVLLRINVRRVRMVHQQARAQIIEFWLEMKCRRPPDKLISIQEMTY